MVPLRWCAHYKRVATSNGDSHAIAALLVALPHGCAAALDTFDHLDIDGRRPLPAAVAPRMAPARHRVNEHQSGKTTVHGTFAVARGWCDPRSHLPAEQLAAGGARDERAMDAAVVAAEPPRAWHAETASVAAQIMPNVAIRFGRVAITTRDMARSSFRPVLPRHARRGRRLCAG